MDFILGLIAFGFTALAIVKDNWKHDVAAILVVGSIIIYENGWYPL